MSKAKFILLTTIAVFNAGTNYAEEGLQNQFFAITDVDKNHDGKVSAKEKDFMKKIIHDVAVKSGATHIPNSLCVDITSGGKLALDDDITYFERGVTIYPDELEDGREEFQYLIDSGAVFSQDQLDDALTVAGNVTSGGNVIVGTDVTTTVPTTDVKLDDGQATIYNFIKGMIATASNVPLFAGLHLGIVLTALNYAEQFNLVELPTSTEARLAFAKDYAEMLDVDVMTPQLG